MTALESSNPGQASFGFSGKGSEYFRIWIVNVALTIVTLGIYSAWAKVRRLKYFYQNTSLLGSHFDYHGDPKKILKGRLIALGLFLAYKLSLETSPKLALVAIALLAAVLPWLIVRSFCFKLHNSSYRGLRFSFRGSTGEGYFSFLLMPVLTMVSLYLLAPLTHQNIKKYQHRNSWFGNSRFGFDAGPGKFYAMYLKLLGLIMLGLVVPVALAFTFKAQLTSLVALGHVPADQQKNFFIGLFAIAFVLFYLLLLALVGPWFAARSQNLVWNHTRLGEHQFVSRVRARKLLWIFLTNLLGTIFSLGLFKPFADIRMARYRIESMGVVPHGDIEQILAVPEEEVTATGEGAADLFDIDISF